MGRAGIIRVLALLVVSLTAGGAFGQDEQNLEHLEPYEGRLIRTLTLLQPGRDEQTGELIDLPLDEELAGLARNQIRSVPGIPFSAGTASGDLNRLNRLGRFRRINVAVTPLTDGSLELVFVFEPSPIIADAQPVGNRLISDQEIAGIIEPLVGTPVDQYQIDRAARQIRELYRQKGYYLAGVTIDEEDLEETGILLFRIREGQRIRVTDIRFSGNAAFTARELRPSVKTREAGLFQKGRLDDDALRNDVDALFQFYRDRGYLDARIDRHVVYSADGKEAIVTFLIDEGQLYSLRSIAVYYPDYAELYATEAEAREAAGPDDRLMVLGAGRVAVYKVGVYDESEIAGLMTMKPGDVYSRDKLDASIRRIIEAYWQMGYADVAITPVEIRDLESAQTNKVDLRLQITEGSRSYTGQVIVVGNELTRAKVIRREADGLRPNRPLDITQIRQVERDLERLRLFAPGSVRVAVQPADPQEPDQRDVLIEVEEYNTGELAFGAQANSDLGVIGTMSLTQRNFDVRDWPDSAGELFRGESFRGGGQTFTITLAPGNEIQTYLVSLSEPHLMDTDYTGSASTFFRNRFYTDYNEERLAARLGFGRTFGRRWDGGLRVRAESVKLQDIEDDAAVDVFDVADRTLVFGVGANLTRTTVDDRFRPSRGSRFELGVEQVGLGVGDVDFTRFEAQHAVFFNLHETFLGHRTVLSLSTEAAYIPQGPDEVPVYERLYRGGRTLRGFGYRGIGPVGYRNDTGELGNDHVGGTWSFFYGAEVTQPVYKDTISIVGFVDSGTVSNDVGFSGYRLAVGTGIRVYYPMLTPAPLAFDFGFPLFKEDTDDTRIFSFSIDLPF